MGLSDAERRRYSRHLLMPEWGEDAQARLKAGRVLLVGLGGLGSPAALYLAAAGVGTLGLVDADVVDETNLQRQVLYGTDDVGQSKMDVAVRRIESLNPFVRVERHDARFDLDNAARLVSRYDVIVDGSDNFPTRYLVNDACVMGGTPNIYGSVSRFEGQAAVFAAPGGPCYRCLHPSPPPEGLIPNCGEAGVLGVLPGLIGTVQATEAIKILTGLGDALVGRVLLVDALKMRFRTIALPRDPRCPACGESPSIRELQRYDLACEPAGVSGGVMTVSELQEWRRDARPHMLVDVREPSEYAARSIDGAVLIPLGTLMDHLERLPTDTPIVVHCKSGGRSARAVAALRAKGYDAHNLVGGIDAWPG